MKNLMKLSALAGFSFAMIVIGACGGGGQGGGGNYNATVTVNGTAYTANGAVQYTVTSGVTYYRTGTDTNWQICQQCGGAGSTSTGTSR